MQPAGAITRRFQAFFSRHLEPLLTYRSIRPAATILCENQSRSGMLHQDHHRAYRDQGANNRSFSLPNGKYDQDGNFNFLSDKDDFTVMSNGGRGDENQNQERPCKLGPLGPAPTNSSSHKNSGILSPRSRQPCWSTLDPLPEIEHGDDGYGRVPPDGAEERRLEEEEGQMMAKHWEKMELQRRKSSISSRHELEEMMRLENDDEWGDSDSESDSGGSMSAFNMETGGDWMGGWDRIGVGEPKLSHQDFDPTRSSYREAAARRRSYGRKSLSGSHLGNLLEEGAEDHHGQSTDSDGELPELMDAVWTLRDRERFKAQEMEKHQVQLTMYRRLALIRWVRTLQGRIQEQQNRLQSSFDVILTHRKELLRMGAAVVNTAPATAVGQS
ncbi:uncharacterized protein LOC129173675 isoform X2 [Dunckerocampus dactyliophorus]|uniref:uncharacterized protein LOC129173675 isoform X2 n=1 Tax=Dunckerocampus dactyliophorus TaxID=161453 RepID=UPI002404DAB0|nr:uncharacterized protein LOC129173675 isoform X2 [Dunckerocampus dactyliophorus]